VPEIEIVVTVRAPVERCFDLARSIDLHQATLAATGERAVAGVTTGLIALGETVTWEARHFGVRQRLTSRITAFDRPHHFRDSMVRGAFAHFDHDHWFEPDGAGRTRMRDRFVCRSPLGALGRLADALFLERYMRDLLLGRNLAVKRVAESDDWQTYLRGSGVVA
jgi:ligand-binding SRPBCC domain-containing protein